MPVVVSSSLTSLNFKGSGTDLWLLVPINPSISWLKNQYTGASLVAQWLGVCLPMQGTWVRALVQEDPTCRGATRLVCHNY